MPVSLSHAANRKNPIISGQYDSPIPVKTFFFVFRERWFLGQKAILVPRRTDFRNADFGAFGLDITDPVPQHRLACLERIEDNKITLVIFFFLVWTDLVIRCLVLSFWASPQFHHREPPNQMLHLEGGTGNRKL